MTELNQPDGIDYFISAGEFLDDALEPFAGKIHNGLATLAPREYNVVKSFLRSNTSELSRQLPLMDPVRVLLLVAFYLATVYVGRRFMEQRKRMDVRVFALCHNAFLASLSTYMFAKICGAFVSSGYSLYGNPTDNSSTGWPMAKAVWLFYFSKPMEFVDTLIMVVKKNDRQISFLHLYHHASVFMYMWLVVLVAPNGDAYLSAALNSFIHIIMYSYYLFSALGVKQAALVRPFITTGQMAQFCIMIANAGYGVMDSLWWRGPTKTYPIMISSAHIIYMLTMLALFLNFFIRDKSRRKAHRMSIQKPTVAKKIE